MAVDWGFIIAAPPPGEYVIRQTWTRRNTPYTYTVNVTVEAPQIIEPTDTTEATQATEAPDVSEPPSTT
jgi:hypothetical protein